MSGGTERNPWYNMHVNKYVSLIQIKISEAKLKLILNYFYTKKIKKLIK